VSHSIDQPWGPEWVPEDEHDDPIADDPDEEDLLHGLNAMWLDELDQKAQGNKSVVVFDAGILYSDTWIPRMLDELMTGLLTEEYEMFLDEIDGADA